MQLIGLEKSLQFQIPSMPISMLYRLSMLSMQRMLSKKEALNSMPTFSMIVHAW